MEKTNPPCPLAIAGEEEEEINIQYQEIWHGETLSTGKTRKKRWIPTPFGLQQDAEGEGRGTKRCWSVGRGGG